MLFYEVVADHVPTSLFPGVKRNFWLHAMCACTG